jgi:hypothetical protein
MNLDPNKTYAVNIAWVARLACGQWVVIMDRNESYMPIFTHRRGPMPLGIARRMAAERNVGVLWNNP